jgi:poly-gamma-glutamate synthesis protein (capsule biosynthesis protein)
VTAAAAPPTDSRAPTTEATITVVGDVNFAGYPVAIDPFAQVTGLLASDLRITNAEGLLTDTTVPRYREARLDIGASPSFVRHFKHFDLIGQANNHSWDAGSEGLLEHLSHFAKHELPTFGAGPTQEVAEAPVRYRVSSKAPRLTRDDAATSPCVSVIGATFKSNRKARPGAFVAFNADAKTRLRLEASIAAEAQRGCFVLVSLHAGREGKDGPDATLRTAVLRLLDAGADLVAAHHPHVLQGVELRPHPSIAGRTQAIAWSLGNFVFRNRTPEKRQSGVLRLTLSTPTSGRPSLTHLELLPTHSDKALLPRPATTPEARAIAALITDRSQRFGTRTAFDAGPPARVHFLPR